MEDNPRKKLWLGNIIPWICEREVAALQIVQTLLFQHTSGLTCVWLAASVLTFRLPIAGVRVTSTMLSCTCYRKEKHLFSDMSFLHYTFKTFILKRSMKPEDPCLKTGYESILRTKKSFLKPLKFRENISPEERRSETFSCRITFLRQRLFWIAEQSETTTQKSQKNYVING